MHYQYFRIFTKNRVFKIFSSIPITLREARLTYSMASRVESIDEGDFV